MGYERVHKTSRGADECEGRAHLGTLEVAGGLARVHLVGEERAFVDHRAASFGDRLLGEQHRTHRRVVDDGISDPLGLLGAREGAHRATLLAVPEGVLEGELCRRDALHGRADARGVDEGEHVVEAAVGLANEPAGRLLELNLARRRAVAAHLVLDARNVHVVEVAHHAFVAHRALGHKEEGDAFRASRCARQPREHAVDDVLGHVVLAARDEDLRARDGVRPIAVVLGLSGDLAEVGSALWLGQTHGACEFSTHQRRQILVLEGRGAVREDRVDRALGEAREHGPRVCGRGRRCRSADVWVSNRGRRAAISQRSEVNPVTHSWPWLSSRPG